MTCIVISTDIFGCDDGDESSEGGLRQRLYDYIPFQQEVDRGGSIYNRTVETLMSLGQSDYFVEALSDNIVFTQEVVQVRDLPLSASNVLVFTDTNTVAGGREAASSPTVTAIFDSTTVKGMAVYVSSSGHVDLSLADSQSTTNPTVGLTLEDVVATGTGYYLTDGQITQSDWTSVTGSMLLVAGATYYLSDSSAGQLTTTPPTANGSLVIRVGTALTTTSMDIEIAQSLLL